MLFFLLLANLTSQWPSFKYNFCFSCMFVFKAAVYSCLHTNSYIAVVCLIRCDNNKRGENWNDHLSEVSGMFQYIIGLGAWAHYGIGYGMGVMFQMKYVVTYGLSCTVARAEQMRTPNHPKCIGRIHLYSDMWRHFDPGLYFFLRKYVVIVIGPSLIS